MSLRVCLEPGCPALVDSGRSRCPTHRREHGRKRGTRQQQGYDAAHDRLRAQWERRLAAGETPMCGRQCGHPVVAGQDWHLDHTDDRTAYLGPSHTLCNLQAAGRASTTVTQRDGG